MGIHEPQIRLKELAIKELNSKEGGFGGYLVNENLIYVGNTMLVICAILSRYYHTEEWQKEIDTYINRCLDTFNSGLGAISSADDLNDLLDDLEEMLKNYRK